MDVEDMWDDDEDLAPFREAASEGMRTEIGDPTFDKNADDMTINELRDSVGNLRCEIVRRGFVEKELRAENERLRQALRFYGHRHHLTLSSPLAWDTISGEPLNYLCDEAGTATIEDGTVARMALLGKRLEDDELLPPIDGEPNASNHGPL